MSQPKRYDTECGYGCIHGAYEYEDGPWVKWEDYDALSAKAEAMHKALRDIESAWFSQRPGDIIKIVDKVFEWRDSK